MSKTDPGLCETFALAGYTYVIPINVVVEIERLRGALKFCGDMAEEELPHAKVGTGAEVVLRHIVRRVGETL